jgi:antitoxin component of MazEF toxin-antitoxin module
LFKVKVIDVGRALGIVLPKAALQRLHVAKGDILHLAVGPDGLHLLRPGDGEVAADIEAGERVIEQYRKGLRALAKM